MGIKEYILLTHNVSVVWSFGDVRMGGITVNMGSVSACQARREIPEGIFLGL